jgi:hypothetical protein
LADVVNLTEVDLLRHENCGRKSVTNFKEVLAKHGFVHTPVSIRLTKQMREVARLFNMTDYDYARNIFELIKEGIWGSSQEKRLDITYRYVWRPTNAEIDYSIYRQKLQRISPIKYRVSIVLKDKYQKNRVSRAAHFLNWFNEAGITNLYDLAVMSKGDIADKCVASHKAKTGYTLQFGNYGAKTELVVRDFIDTIAVTDLSTLRSE